MFERIIVIGSPGSGKSTFSRKLRDITHLPLYYLDMIHHKPDRTEAASEEFDMRLQDILKEKQWIIDGNYQRTLEWRLSKCDTVILFDLPTEVCLAGAKARIGTKREDLPWVETEEDLQGEFEQAILEFREKKLSEIMLLVKKYSDKEIIIFYCREDADRYLEELYQNKMQQS